ncbi:MAG TPA: DegT/DnrJ/EryC1/StrS family aminotransferase [Blastocatellia bacterium]|nr:DegT/DnrJ/EryC1/StrS family aminotransferase [Blastocatellia bacterium]
MKVPFGDLRRQYEGMRERIDEAIRGVLNRGWFILGAEVESFEREFADYLGARHAIGVGSGTEAIHLALVAAGVRPGDEVITAANTCVPTVSAISFAGAVPAPVDVDEVSYNLDPGKLEAAITGRTRAILPVHLYGQAADMAPILEIGRRSRIPVIEDAAQGHGAGYKGARLGTFGGMGCFSFYPSKNLGAFGDAGAVVTDDDELALKLKRLRNYGEERRYHHSSKGFNSRLDEIQAAILRVKLPELDRWNARRREIASFYDREIMNPQVRKPVELGYGHHNYHLYVIRCARRDELQRHLADAGVSTLIHYPVPFHLQEAYRDLNKKPGDYPAAESCANEVLSLPIFPELSDEEARYVAECVNGFE